MSTQSVLVTGATSGIGLAICRKFGAHGATVLAHGRNEAKLKNTADLLRSEGVSVLEFVADLALEDGPSSLLDQIEESGQIVTDLVNNAGGLSEDSFDKQHLSDPAETYRVNVFAAYELTLRCAANLGTTSVVNISSVHAHAPWGSRVPHYSSAKAALSTMTRMLAIKLADGTRVNAVSPGRTITGAWDDLSEAAKQTCCDETLIRRWIQPSEIADAVWFLAQNKACTGTDLLVDGGMSISPIGANT